MNCKSRFDGEMEREDLHTEIVECVFEKEEKDHLRDHFFPGGKWHLPCR